MPLATSPATDELAYALASLRGLTADEAVASALRAQLERPVESRNQSVLTQPEPSVEELLRGIRTLGPWRGADSTKLTDELYDADGLPR